MKLTFCIAVLKVLCSTFMARTVLVAHLYFGYCWNSSCLHGIKASLLPLWVDWAWERGWEGTRPRQLTWTGQSVISYHITSFSVIKAQGEEESGTFVVLAFVFSGNRCPFWGVASQGAASASGAWIPCFAFLVLLLFLLNSHCLCLWDFLRSLCFLPILQEWVRSWVGVWLLAGVNPPHSFYDLTRFFALSIYFIISPLLFTFSD